MDINNEKIAIGWIDSGQIQSGFAAYMSQILLHRNHMISDVIVASGPYLSLNRNKMVESFLDNSKSDWLFSFDSDILVDLHSFDILTNCADKDHYPIMGGKYYLALDGRVHLSAMKKHPEDPKMGLWLQDESRRIVDDLHSVGLGFCLIHRKVFEEIRNKSDSPYPWFQDAWVDFNPKLGNASWCSDDIWFFRQVADLGYNVAIDLNTSSTHMKQSKLNDDAYLTFNKYHEYEHKIMHNRNSEHNYNDYEQEKKNIWRVFRKESKA